jgi:prepilin-type N-terminal cleavage/methylation domain-containing protein
VTGRPRQTGGFTFLELVVVLAILAVITAAVIPVYGASIAAMKQRSFRGDLTATIYYLQELSIQQSRELRLYVDRREGSYWTERWVSGFGEDKVFEPLGDRNIGQEKSLPGALKITRIKARDDRGTGINFIAFYPNGSCDAATISFGERRGGKTTFRIETTGALGDVLVTK